MAYGMLNMQTCNSAAAMAIEKNLPSSAYTAFLVELAVDPLVAIAEIEAEKKPTSASLWAAIAISKLKTQKNAPEGASLLGLAETKGFEPLMQLITAYSLSR